MNIASTSAANAGGCAAALATGKLEVNFLHPKVKRVKSLSGLGVVKRVREFSSGRPSSNGTLGSLLLFSCGFLGPYFVSKRGDCVGSSNNRSCIGVPCHGEEAPARVHLDSVVRNTAGERMRLYDYVHPGI